MLRGRWAAGRAGRGLRLGPGGLPVATQRAQLPTGAPLNSGPRRRWPHRPCTSKPCAHCHLRSRRHPASRGAGSHQGGAVGTGVVPGIRTGAEGEGSQPRNLRKFLGFSGSIWKCGAAPQSGAGRHPVLRCLSPPTRHPQPCLWAFAPGSSPTRRAAPPSAGPPPPPGSAPAPTRLEGPQAPGQGQG